MRICRTLTNKATWNFSVTKTKKDCSKGEHPVSWKFIQLQLWNQFRTSHIQHETDYRANRKIYTFQGIHKTTDRTLKRRVRKGTDELLYSNGIPVAVKPEL
jgi:hypothetical protein